MKSREIRQELLKVRDITLEKTIDAYNVVEIGLKQSNSINNEETIHRIRNRGAKTRSRTPEIKNNREKCSKCNFNHERNRMNIPARDKKCSKCNEIGDFTICCRNMQSFRQDKRSHVHNLAENESR